MKAAIDDWLETLGYDGSVGVVHRAPGDVRADHPYAREIDLMLRTPGASGAAVFEVDRVPAVCFVEPDGSQPLDARFIDEVRSKIWNQNLVSIVVIVKGREAVAYPAPRDLPADFVLSLDRANAEGRFSATEVARGDIANRLPEWFNRTHRVDRVMQDNLDVAVETLKELEHRRSRRSCCWARASSCPSWSTAAWWAATTASATRWVSCSTCCAPATAAGWIASSGA